ncbi:MAG TPA: 2-amino-4-hydroxy-6-hydroxymethyldihydropteridine diphosphokinase [Chthoniobacterales bacterium]|nr:2-amino-4-hydroxy-6-hydroxymethyldihydropteridine diphosphokinase [Chthoniobacterales bacterium]
MRAGVALGSNLGDRLGNLSAARKAIAALAGVRAPMVSSAVYETDPVGCEPGAPGFLNAAIEFDYRGEAIQLFQELRRIEIALGRPAQHERNVSRPIDIDLLYFDDITLATEQLTLPHPRIFEREFVLRPLADIQPNRVLPGQTKTITELLALTASSGRVERATSKWED